jgi:hypothetical protein
MGEAMETPSDVITITYECTSQELREAIKVMAKPVAGQPRLKKSGGVAKFVIILGLELAIMVGYIYLDPPEQSRFTVPGLNHADPAPSKVLFFEWMAAAGVAVFMLGFAPSHVIRWIPQNRWQGKVQFSFQQDGLVERRPNRSSKLKWDAFRGVDEGQNVFALRFAATKSMVFPKRLFRSEDEVAHVLQMLRTKTTREAIPYSTAFEIVAKR